MNPELIVQDDLTAIKGIGEARQNWLREVLEVGTYRDLAALPGGEAVAALKAAGHRVTLPEMEAWIEAAGALVADPPADPEKREMGRPAASAEAKSRPGGGEWRSIAEFIVDFQQQTMAGGEILRRTKVHRMADGKENIWREFAAGEMEQWMAAHLNLDEERPPVKPRAAVDREQPAAAPAAPVHIAIVQLRAFQPPDQEAPLTLSETGPVFAGPLHGHVPFDLEVTYELTGNIPSSLLPQAARCQVEVYASRRTGRTDGQEQLLAKTAAEPTPAGSARFAVRLPELALDPGIYRVQAIVGIPGESRLVGFLELPVLQVY